MNCRSVQLDLEFEINNDIIIIIYILYTVYLIILFMNLD